MKVIFLDFDGVLNHREFIYSLSKRHARFGLSPRNEAEKSLVTAVSEDDDIERHLWDFRSIDRKKVRLLDKIVQKTGAKVVVSSSWRRKSSRDYLELYLRCLGFSGEIIGITPTDLHCREEYKDVGFIRRGWEIQEWLKEHPEVSSFVILDDESDMDGVMERLVKTSFETGLLPQHVSRAIELLNT